VFLGAETVGELGSVLEGFELALGERIVVGDIRTAVGLGDPQRSQQLSDGVGLHRRSAVAVDGERRRGKAEAPGRERLAVG